MKINLEDEKYKNIKGESMDLLKRMLIANPKNRISAAEALNHSYFQFFKEECPSEKISSPCHTEVSEKKRNYYYCRN